MSARLLSGYVALTLVAIVLAVVFVAAVLIITQETPSGSELKTHARYYVVKRGDSLSGISEKTGLPLDRLEELNPGVDPLALAPGKRLRLKPLPPGAAARARRKRRAPGPRTYTVKRGDALSTIAERTGVPLYRLLELNPRAKKGLIVPGQRIKLRRDKRSERLARRAAR